MIPFPYPEAVKRQIRELLAHHQVVSPDRPATRHIESYLRGFSPEWTSLEAPEDQAILVQAASVVADMTVFHGLLDQASSTLTWEPDRWHPFFLAYDMGHAPEAFARVATAEVILGMADTLSNDNLILVDPWLVAGVTAGWMEPVQTFMQAFPNPSFPLAQAAMDLQRSQQREAQLELLAQPQSLLQPTPLKRMRA